MEIEDLNTKLPRSNEIYRTFNPTLSKINILLNSTWNILKDRPVVRPQNKSSQNNLK